MNYRNKRKDYALYPTVQFDDIRHMLRETADKYGERIAVSYRQNPHDAESVKLSFETIYENVRALATELIARGLRDKKVALVGENSIGWIYSYLALTSMGAVVVPIDKEYPAPDMASILNTARCDALLFSPVIKDKYNVLKESVPTLNFGAAFYTGKGFEDFLTLDALITSGKQRLSDGDTAYDDYEIDPDGMVSIVFTSGTTGKGKGVMLSTRNILEDMSKGINQYAREDSIRAPRAPHLRLNGQPHRSLYAGTSHLYKLGKQVYSLGA